MHRPREGRERYQSVRSDKNQSSPVQPQSQPQNRLLFRDAAGTVKVVRTGKPAVRLTGAQSSESYCHGVHSTNKITENTKHTTAVAVLSLKWM